MPRKAFTVIGMACKALGLPGDFRPVSRIRDIFTGLDLGEIISCLRTSIDENAQVMCALYDRLNAPHRKAIDIDFLIAAAKCRDPHTIAGLICENYSRVKTLESNFIAARESPGIMKEASRRAQQKNGFQYGRMVLQTSGVVPMPKNTVTITTTKIGKIDNSNKLTLNGVQSHQGTVIEVSEILRQLPQNVAPPSHLTEDQSDRELQEHPTERI